MSQMLSAISHCHANGVIHRDIKPENIMLTKGDKIRLIDFGLSKIAAGVEKEIAGTPYYMSPEMLGSKYNEKTDMWSMGVLLYVLVSGYLPFQGKTSAEVFKKIRAGQFHFRHKEFESVSAHCKDLISEMLTRDPIKRPSASTCLKHPYFDIL